MEKGVLNGNFVICQEDELHLYFRQYGKEEPYYKIEKTEFLRFILDKENYCKFYTALDSDGELKRWVRLESGRASGPGLCNIQ
jgi:hypothetical protein